MKKLAQSAAFFAALTLGSFAFVACNSADKTEEETTEMAAAAYACPMDCEDGKTYTEPGTCPVCGMDLKEVNN